MNQTECPYCEEVNEIDQSDWFESDEQIEMHCESCGLNFITTPIHKVTFSSAKAPCLNGGEHDYTQWAVVKSDAISTIYIRDCLCCGKMERKTE